MPAVPGVAYSRAVKCLLACRLCRKISIPGPSRPEYSSLPDGGKAVNVRAPETKAGVGKNVGDVLEVCEGWVVILHARKRNSSLHLSSMVSRATR